MRNVAEMGLQILYQMLQKIAAHEAAQSFYQTYYTDIMQHVLSVVTDSSHTPGSLHFCLYLLSYVVFQCYIFFKVALRA